MFVVRREPHNPILAPMRDRPWEAMATYNPSAIRTKEGVRIFYRAIGNPDALVSPGQGVSSIGTAFSEDGVHFHSRKQILEPQTEFDRFGCEDPRATFFEGKWYVFYTALGGYPFGPDNIKVGVACGDSPEHFPERHLITPFNAKAATLFPERIDGDVVLLLTAHTDWTGEHPRPTIAIARAKQIEDFWNKDFWLDWHAHLETHALAELRRIDGDHIEVGAAPIQTERGWLLVYSYIEDYYDASKRTFTIEAALLETHDPRMVISRTESFLVPEEIYERYGLVPNIAFPSGATVREDGMLEIWYGAADTVCAKATVRLSGLIETLTPDRTAHALVRAKENPLILPQGKAFESRDTFNAAGIHLNGSTYLLYRAMDAVNTSRIGCAISSDGIHIDERLPEPIYEPRAEFEQKKGATDGNSGCEDPRVVQIGDTLYMTYTAYDGVHAPKGAISSISVADFLAKDFSKWRAPVLLTPDEIDDKDLALLPEKRDGNFLLYHRVNNQICADLLPDLVSGKRVSRCIEIMQPRHGMWDSQKVGIAGPPIKIDGGWLMIYHGVSRHSTYRLGAALLDESGLQVLARSADPLFEPIEAYEREGEVHNVVFSCGQTVRGDTLYLYYGAADHVLAVATGSLSHILTSLA